MKTAEERGHERADIFAPDGYEWKDAPEDMEEALNTASALPGDFLPPPEKLVFRRPKKPTTIRIDEDVLDWFKSLGKGYQTKINAVLRAYKSSHSR
jgi:uncharacterized protein (DUF4415 family)